MNKPIIKLEIKVVPGSDFQRETIIEVLKTLGRACNAQFLEQHKENMVAYSLYEGLEILFASDIDIENNNETKEKNGDRAGETS